MSGTVTIERRAAGTYTMTVKRDGETIRERAGIETLAEAKSHAAFWQREMGYRLRINGRPR